VSFFFLLLKKTDKNEFRKHDLPVQKRAATSEPIGGTLKFEVDGVGILIDGTGDTNTVQASDSEADCKISLTAEVLEKLRDGDINPMMAVMGGQIKISGDMGLAMKVQSLMG